MSVEGSGERQPHAEVSRRTPWLSRVLLSAALHPEDRDFALADLEEEFEQRLERLGRWPALRWYHVQAMRSLLPSIRGRFVRRRAGRDFAKGNQRGGTMWDGLRDFMGDLRRAARSLRKSPAVLLITVISLGIGIGAMTSVFSVANSLLFRGSVGINDPETLVAIYTTGDGGGAYGASSLPDYLDLLQEAPALEDATLINMRTISSGRPDEAVALLAEEVTGNYFEVTGIRPVIGRSFLSEESVIGSSARVAMIGHDRWQNDFDGQLDVLGSEIRINGYRHTIVGVVPDGVLSRIIPLEPDVWVPFNSVGLEASTKAALIGQRGHRSYRILGRLAPGSSQEALESQLGVLSSRLLAQYPEEWVDDTGNPRSFVLLDEAESRLGANAKLLIGGIAAFFFVAVGLILLIACANVTTLFLARAANRNREMAVRVSLGASRHRLVIMFLTEGLIPGLGAGLLGLAVASGINHAINMAIASVPFGLPLRFSFGIDGRVMAVAMLLSLGSSLVFGLVPALEGSRPNLVPSLKGDGGGASRSGGLKLRNVLVATQCAASVILLVGASLFVRALSKASETDFGLDPTRIAITTKKLDAEGFSEVEGLQYIRDLQATLVARPDVEVAHVSRSMEMTLLSLNPTLAVEVEAAGYVPVDPEKEQFWRNSVTPGYLDMLGVQILRGRALDATDVAGGPLAAVVNETFAERLWPGQDPIGHTFQAFGRAPSGTDEDLTPKRSFLVVGMAKNTKYFDFDDPPLPYYWTSIYQDYAAHIVVLAKGTVSAEAMIPLLRENVRLASGEVQMAPPGTLTEQFAIQFIHLRIAASVLKWGGLFGLFLAVIGIYGIVSFAVTQKTREVAIRMALGAERRQVLARVVRDGMRPALVGLGAGALVAYGGARLLTSVLYGISPMDPLAFLGGTGLLALAALVASVIPARAALGISPMEALRDE